MNFDAQYAFRKIVRAVFRCFGERDVFLGQLVPIFAFASVRFADLTPASIAYFMTHLGRNRQRVEWGDHRPLSAHYRDKLCPSIFHRIRKRVSKSSLVATLNNPFPHLALSGPTASQQNGASIWRCPTPAYGTVDCH